MENRIFEYPLVSVIIPTYKRSDFLPRAIASVLGQTYQRIQAVVIDDNNPDTEWRIQTEKLMSQYAADSRVKYVQHEKNMNGSAARNTGIREADGEIICFLDDDDEFNKNKVQVQVDYLLTHPEYRAVYCGWDRDGQRVLPQKEGDLSYDILSGRNLIYTNTIMMWRLDALQCGGWDESFKRHQEAAFLLRYFRAGGLIGVTSQALVQFDISDRSNEAANSDIYQKYLDHYLNSYVDMIERCEGACRGAKKDIYANRYRGALLAHIKARNFKSAWKLYWKMTLKMPFRFNWAIIIYCANYRKNHRRSKF